jgi:hypothetical protein
MQPKAGYKTSEFWLHGILQVLLLLNTVGVWNYMNPKYTVLVQGILGAAYAFSRGLAKVASPPAVEGTPSMLFPTEPPTDGTTEPPAAQ